MSITRKIAMNARRNPNRGVAMELGMEDYDKLSIESWLAKDIDDIRDGKEELKSGLPFRCAHYYRFNNNHRTQKDADPEALLFQTTVDVDDEALVDGCIKRAYGLNDAETGSATQDKLWKGMLLHMEYSARKKLHIDVRMPVGMTISETQKAYCEALDIPEMEDKSVTSPERMIYITDKRQEIFRSPDWYAVLSDEELAVRRKAFTDRGLTIDGRETDKNGNVVKTPTRKKIDPEKRGDSSITVPGTVIEKNVEIPSPSSLIAFDLCVKNAGLNADNMDVWGEHNWHTNLMAVLSVGLPKLMSREQLLAVVNAKLPNYSQTEDCKKLIEYFYENYTADKGFMSTTLREINAKAQELSKANADVNADADVDGEGVLEEITEGWEPPKMPKKIPRLVDLELRDFDPRYRESLGLTSTVGHSGIASHFRAKYLNNKILTPAMMVSVIGGSGSGKDYCTQLFNAQMLHTLDDNDDREWAKVRANAELREKMKNSKECPPKYHPKIRVFESASKTSLLELQTNLGANGMLVGIFSEADGFVGASQASWSNISVLLRKGYSGDKQRQFYMAESTCNTNTPLNISLLMEGTPKAILERMFSDRNCENGTMQRFVPVLMPKKKRTFRPPMQNFLTEDERKERDALLMELYQKDLALGDDTLVLETPKTCNAIGQWFDSLEERYNDGLMTEAEADLSRRCGEFILRAAIPLIALYGETKEVVDYSVWVGDMAYYNMCRIYGHRVQEDLNASNELMTARLDARKTAEPLLDKMPMIFNIKQFKEERVKAGQSTNVKMLLSRYCKNGKLEKVGRGVYRKGNIVSVTKTGDTNGTNENDNENENCNGDNG